MNAQIEHAYATKSSINATPKIQEGLPLYMRDGGKEVIGERRKELETYLKLLSIEPYDMLQRTFIIINPHTLDPQEVGQEEATAIEKWWMNKETKQKLIDWFRTNEHKVNGKFGNWSAGFLGSRWADTEINGRNCRLAFYSRKHNPESFSPEMDEKEGKKYNYALMIDPTL
jgi:hypothetical protein